MNRLTRPILGALLAVLGATEQASDLVREIPFAARTSLLVFDFKVVLLAGIFVYAFFRFTWCIRQYSVGVLMVAAAPEAAASAAGAAAPGLSVGTKLPQVMRWPAR